MTTRKPTFVVKRTSIKKTKKGKVVAKKKKGFTRRTTKKVFTKKGRR